MKFQIGTEVWKSIPKTIAIKLTNLLKIPNKCYNHKAPTNEPV